MSVPYAEDLRRTVTTAAPRLRALTAIEAATPRVKGKWSPKQIIGHLVDSASNNHGRFVRAQLADSMRFEGYDQERWVEVQKYKDAPWRELVDLWEAFNLHIARVMEAASEAARTKPRGDHALHRLAWVTVPEGEPTTLEYFMRDYVGHLKHHLRQIDPALADGQ
jgi:hypothetical protein